MFDNSFFFWAVIFTSRNHAIWTCTLATESCILISLCSYWKFGISFVEPRSFSVTFSITIAAQILSITIAAQILPITIDGRYHPLVLTFVSRLFGMCQSSALSCSITEKQNHELGF
ncbi:hypothetical protein QVD17_01221 [Tagetes erecta]|uniref:Uncharacterized protein n=1 Tax=Tagetes erecta TaxID=13708 RepID=A0AAD8L9B7_TARER|nr:hypothetical protein QVD17_01221 [Tagetes erecta]